MTTITISDKHSITIPEGATIGELAITKITKRAFMKRFTVSEWAAIKASTDATVLYFMEQFQLATFIDVTDPDTVGGIAYLSSLGLLEASRQAEVLADGTAEEAA